MGSYFTASICTIALSSLLSSMALASENGKVGYSGNPAVNAGKTCLSCHGGGAAPTVSIIGPSAVTPGSTNAYILKIAGANAGGGLDVSANGGTLAVSEAGTQLKTYLTSNEITHTTPRTAVAGVLEFKFNWTAPSTPGTATLYGTGNSVDGDLSELGDYSAAAQLAITVAAANQPPVANAGGPYTAETAKTAQFDGSKSADPDGTIASHSWDFGDGAMGSGATPTHAYGKAGVYTVTLTVTDNQGATGKATTTATITDPAPPNQPPVANAGGPYSGLLGELIAMSGLGSKDPDGTIASYSWDFGDGSMGSGAMPSHAYAMAGAYTVTLTVTDNAGATGKATATATITRPNNLAPVADAGGPYSGAKRKRIQFNGSGSKDPDGTIVSYQWKFGDGKTGSGPMPRHAYRRVGTYTVTLTVTDDSGAMATATATVQIQ